MAEIYKFFLTDLDGRAQVHEPRNWDNMNFRLKRSGEDAGVILEMALAMEYVYDGYEKLLRAFQRDLEQVIVAEIQKRDYITGRMEEIYRGRVHLSRQAVFNREDKIASVQIERSDFALRFRNLMDVPVNLFALNDVNGNAITPNANEVVNITLHSQPLAGRFRALAPAPAVPVPSQPIDEAEERTATVILGFSRVEIDELEETFSLGTGFALDDARFEFHRAKAFEVGTIEYDIQTTFVVDRLTGDFDTVETQLVYQVNDEAPSILATHIDNAVGGSYVQDLNAAGSLNLNLSPGDKVYLYGTIRIADVAGNYSALYTVTLKDPSFVDIQVNTTTDPTTCNGMLVFEAMARICQHHTGQQDAFRSDYLGRTDSEFSYGVDGPGSLEFITNGERIRQKSSIPLSTTFKDFFASRNGRHSLGWAVEKLPGGQQVIRVENREFFFKREKVLDLGCVPNLKTKVLPDLIYNQALFGYHFDPKEKIGSLEEFNSNREYSLPITQLSGKLDVRGPFVAAGVRIEQQRRLVDKPTLDADFDQENFVISLIRSGGSFAPERDENLLNQTGINNPESRYNIRQSPGRSRKAWEPIMRAAASSKPDLNARFISGTANFEVTSQLQGESAPISESGDVVIGAMDNPYFLPFIDEFNFDLSSAQVKELQQNPYGVITYADNEQNLFQGFIWDIEFRERGEPRTECAFQCLRIFGKL